VMPWRASVLVNPRTAPSRRLWRKRLAGSRCRCSRPATYMGMFESMKTLNAVRLRSRGASARGQPSAHRDSPAARPSRSFSGCQKARSRSPGAPRRPWTCGSAQAFSICRPRSSGTRIWSLLTWHANRLRSSGQPQLGNGEKAWLTGCRADSRSLRLWRVGDVGMTGRPTCPPSFWGRGRREGFLPCGPPG
jgi:hypothetical protein